MTDQNAKKLDDEHILAARRSTRNSKESERLILRTTTSREPWLKKRLEVECTLFVVFKGCFRPTARLQFRSKCFFDHLTHLILMTRWHSIHLNVSILSRGPTFKQSYWLPNATARLILCRRILSAYWKGSKLSNNLMIISKVACNFNFLDTLFRKYWNFDQSSDNIQNPPQFCSLYSYQIAHEVIESQPPRVFNETKNLSSNISKTHRIFTRQHFVN